MRRTKQSPVKPGRFNQTIQRNLIAQSDSPVVWNARLAGGIIVGRTNTPAFSLRWFTKNDLHGQTLNPRDYSITPGGSSGGAAAAVASGMCALGHGTDIAGSIRYPAFACGLHGLRPTLGRIAAHNSSGKDRHIGAQLMAVSGPICRTISDIKIGLEAMSVGSKNDPWYVPTPINQGEFPRLQSCSSHLASIFTLSSSNLLQNLVKTTAENISGERNQ